MVRWIAVAAALAVGPAGGARPQQQDKQEIRVGNLVDRSGPTAAEGRIAGQGKLDAIAYVNKTGGINGKQLRVDTVDFGYEPERAMTQYRRWRQEGVQAILGYGTEDTEALAPLSREDKMLLFSLAAPAQLADPQGKGPRGSRPAPYVFFATPTYSDGVRALLLWAMEDWRRKGGKGRPRFVHMGADHPFPNAPRAAGEAYARELGFDVLPAIRVPMANAGAAGLDGQCLTLRIGEVSYAFLANPSTANVALMRACREAGATAQFLVNAWGLHEIAMKAAGRAADGAVTIGATAPWGSEVPGMKVLQEVARNSDPSGKEYRPLPYARAACGVFYMAEAMKWADQNGGLSEDNIRKGMYQRKGWVPYGLDGVCGPASWSDSDHRAVTQFQLLRAAIKGPTGEGEVGELMRNGTMAWKPVYSADIPRRPDWLGW